MVISVPAKNLNCPFNLKGPPAAFGVIETGDEISRRSGNKALFYGFPRGQKIAQRYGGKIIH